MNTIKTLTFFIVLTVIISCKKDSNPQPSIPIPNGDFENWTSGTSSNGPLLQDWVTNSCPACVPPVETYIVQKDSLNTFHGKYAAKFVDNTVYPAQAQNKFAVPYHPSTLSAYIKPIIYGGDTVSIKIRLFENKAVVDSGQWLGTSSSSSYGQLVIFISHNSMQVDSAQITIRGGHKSSGVNTTVFWVDDLSLQ
jgi:hypothetical protein